MCDPGFTIAYIVSNGKVIAVYRYYVKLAILNNALAMGKNISIFLLVIHPSLWSLVEPRILSKT